ncbi:hypothetical protein F383_19847 [Gossypium arboreum]|uniref:Uncharacterized protein n=1 Tax=Gossypium arboreum TaxID=29729 RepID=A0A0B0MLU4_GOSAR|nr:hypothetical protein F383_19847 [Gossypium arboreum]
MSLAHVTLIHKQ